MFDSGLGGLTVVRALRKRLPGESLIYFGDTARVPYGSKSAATVLRYTRQVTEFLADREVKLIVAACNTVSAVALETVRKEMAVPMIGVIEPGARAACEATRSGHVGVIGTLATISSGAYTSALRILRPACRVESVACPLFVPLAEEGWTNGPAARSIAETYLAPFSENGVDTVILGCTHYPLLKEVIHAALPDGVRLVDSAEAVSAEVASLLDNLRLAASEGTGSLACYVTDVPQRFEELGTRFLGAPLGNVSLVSLD